MSASGPLAALLVLVLLQACALSAHGAATMTLQSGKMIDLDAALAAAKGVCCQPAAKVTGGDDSPIARMDGSRGAFYVTNDPQCRNVITSSAYPTTFSYIYLCGQCKGGCPSVDGGKTVVMRGGACSTSDISKLCSSAAPVCSGSPGVCKTLAEVLPPSPTTAVPPKPPTGTCNCVCPNQVNNGPPCTCGYTFCFGKCSSNANVKDEWTKAGKTPPSECGFA